MTPPPQNLPPHLSGPPAVTPAGAAGAGGGSAPAPAPVRGSRAARNAAREHTARERARIAVRGVGEVLITLGLVLLLFCGYQLYWTDVTSDRATNAVLADLDESFAAPVLVGNEIPPFEEPEMGEPFARMYVPAFGKNWVKPILQGVALVDLHKGVGHYEKSAMPGELGNFAVAGHRTTNGHPFRDIDDLELGDKIFVETKYAWYTYQVTETRLIVSPKDTYVVAPNPVKGKTGAAPTRRLMTMTSCHPPYSASQRMITHAELVGDPRPRSLGPPPGAPPGVS